MSDSSAELLQTIDRIDGVAEQLAKGLQQAIIAQNEAEARRDAEERRSRRRFIITTLSICLAIVLVSVTAVVLFNGQIKTREDADIRSNLNRDRQQCATALLVEFDRRLGEALRVTTQLPRVDPASPEYRFAVDKLNEATTLVTRAPELCYSGKPNPDPVPN